MGLESATYINDLVSSNPAATDLRGQGDDHIRLIKAAVKATFPNATKPFYLPSGTTAQTSTVTVAASDDNKLIPVNCQSGAITVNLPQGSTLVDGFTVKIVKADHSNNVLTIDGYSTETVNGALTVSLWQRYQQATLQWLADISAWIANIPDVPPIGTVSPYSGTTAPAGWILMNGQSIGNTSSGASARANVDCRGLYYHLWANYSNSFAGVSGGRGVSAQADFDANKAIVVPGMQGRDWVGMDTIGGVSGGILGAVTSSITTNGNTIGLEYHQLTSAESGQKAISGAPVTIFDPSHLHTLTGAPYGGNTATFDYNLGGSTEGIRGASSISYAAAFTGITASFTLAGSSAASVHNNMQPGRLGTWMIKL